jgi:hypothetical protein
MEHTAPATTTPDDWPTSNVQASASSPNGRGAFRSQSQAIPDAELHEYAGGEQRRRKIQTRPDVQQPIIELSSRYDTVVVGQQLRVASLQQRLVVSSVGCGVVWRQSHSRT